MPILDINGIEVHFPFQAYECQVNYMKAVLDSIIQKKNAILESPTGTGKTLCLLCSSISWLLAAKADMQFSIVQNELGESNPEMLEASNTASNFINKSGVDASKLKMYPKIIYASRTHSQLSQVIRELKMTKYNNIKTCAIGSRDQLCINPQVKEQRNYTAKLNMCKSKVNSKTCYFYNNIENNLNEIKQMLTVDIEDLNKFGNLHKCCPYYTARNMKDGADILFMPYNYLLDKKLRKSNGIDIVNSIIIFDEAHNVERVCEDSASSEISVIEIASAMNEITYILEEFRDAPDDQDQDATPFRDAYGKENLMNDDPNDNMSNMPASLSELKELTTALKSFEDELDKLKEIGTDGLTKPASFLFEMLNKCNIHFGNRQTFFDILGRLLQYFGALSPSPRHHNGASLGKFNDFLQTVFTDNKVADEKSGDVNKKINLISRYYKVHIKQDAQKKRTLCYWCLCPGYSMQDLLAEGARCVILTSGTLSPISTFKDEMKIPFDIVLENPHIITESQIKVIALSKGPKSVVLSSKYNNRDSEDYLESLGQLVLQFARVVPHGLLVFFPSYRALDVTTEYWRRNNRWKEISDAKPIFSESKDTKECNDTVAKYYERIKEKRGTGACMFAVCRGKISEGIDFADNNGRAVIVTGLPFPLWTDPKIILKRKYLDESKMSSGTLWYNQQTYRAVNQAIGRVIRHRNDYGAIILCDERFSQQSSITQLPGWMKNHVKKLTDFNLAVNELKSFFNVAIEKHPVETPKIPSLKSDNVTYLKADCNGKKSLMPNESVQNMFSSYNPGASACCSSSLSDQSNCNNGDKNFFDALANYGSARSQATGQNCNPSTGLSDGKEDFNSILQKRKMEESKNAKCKVVIRQTVTTAGEVKAESLSGSKALLEKIGKTLIKEDYEKFRLGLNNFYQAKKSGDNEKKVKYYKVLRALFENETELFKELEKFIQFTGVVKDAFKKSDITKAPIVKRKIDDCD